MSNTPQKPRPVRKYITVPEYKPLYALAKTFGPTHGPLDRPVPTTIAVIGELLRQHDTVHVFEVKKMPDGTYSDPVQLTLENYSLSYDEVKAGKKIPATRQEPAIAKETPVAPKITGLTPKPIAQHTEPAVITVPDDTSKAVVHELNDTVNEVSVVEPVTVTKPAEEPVVNTVPEPEESTPAADEPAAGVPAAEEAVEEVAAEPEEEPAVEEVPTEETASEHKLTKAERKALRRAEREKMGTANQ